MPSWTGCQDFKLAREEHPAMRRVSSVCRRIIRGTDGMMSVGGVQPDIWEPVLGQRAVSIWSDV